MRKSDLRTGMLLEQRNGALAMVLLGTEHGDIASGEETWFPISQLNEDLTYKITLNQSDRPYDIIRIYQPKSVMQYLSRGLSTSDANLIWERPCEPTNAENK